MARITGFQCDVCKEVTTGDEASAIGNWLRLTSRADKDNAGFDICSNRCLLKLARERADASGEINMERRGRYNDEQKLEIIAFAVDNSNLAAAEKFGIAATTIPRWKKELGV